MNGATGTPLAVGDMVYRGFGRHRDRAVWEVAELPHSRALQAQVRLESRAGAASGGGKTCYVTLLRISQGYLVRCDRTPIAEATHS